MITLIGRFADNLGAGIVGRRLSIQRAADYLLVQPGCIPMDVRHGVRVGEVLHLEYHPDGIVAVGVVETHLALLGLDLNRLAYSPETYADETIDGRRRNIQLRALALTDTPAGYGLGTVAIHRGDIRDCSTLDMLRARNVVQYATLERAALVARTRTAGEPIQIIDPRSATKNRTSSTRADEGNVTADATSGTFFARLPGQPVPNARLVWGRDPIAKHHPNGDRDGLRCFHALRTARAREALVLVADGVLDTARAHPRGDGRWIAANLDA